AGASLHPGDPIRCLEHPGTGPMGAKRQGSCCGARTPTMALGLWGHLFPVRSTGSKGGKSAQDLEPGDSDDPSRGGCVTGTTLCRSPAAGSGTGGQGLGGGRWGDVDLESDGRSFCPSSTTTGLLSRQPT